MSTACDRHSRRPACPPTERGPSLVVGGDGLIGSALSDALRGHGRAVVATTRRPGVCSPVRPVLDLRGDPSQWRWEMRPEVVFLCAAVTSIQACRQRPGATCRINVQDTVRWARHLVEDGAFVVFLSTNHVFDGAVPNRAADDPRCPRSEYGRQKASAEEALGPCGSRVSIVRLTKVLGPRIPLLTEWRDALKQARPIHPFREMRMAPVPLNFVVECLLRIAQHRAAGVVQVSGARDVSYVQVAEVLGQRLGVDADLIQPTGIDSGGLKPEEAPWHTTLDTTRLRSELGLVPPPVWETIEGAVNEALGP